MESAGRFPGCDQATPAPAAAGRTFAPSADGGTPLETSPWLVEDNVVCGGRDVTGAPARLTRPARALHEPGDCTGASPPAPSPRTSFPSRGPGTRGHSRNRPGRARPDDAVLRGRMSRGDRSGVARPGRFRLCPRVPGPRDGKDVRGDGAGGEAPVQSPGSCSARAGRVRRAGAPVTSRPPQTTLSSTNHGDVSRGVPPSADGAKVRPAAAGAGVA